MHNKSVQLCAVTQEGPEAFLSPLACFYALDPVSLLGCLWHVFTLTHLDRLALVFTGLGSLVRMRVRQKCRGSWHPSTKKTHFGGKSTHLDLNTQKMGFNTSKMGLNTPNTGLNTLKMCLISPKNGSQYPKHGSQHLDFFFVSIVRFWVSTCVKKKGSQHFFWVSTCAKRVSTLFWGLDMCKMGLNTFLWLNMCKMGLDAFFGSQHVKNGSQHV